MPDTNGQLWMDHTGYRTSMEKGETRGYGKGFQYAEVNRYSRKLYIYYYYEVFLIWSRSNSAYSILHSVNETTIYELCHSCQ